MNDNLESDSKYSGDGRGEQRSVDLRPSNAWTNTKRKFVEDVEI